MQLLDWLTSAPLPSTISTVTITNGTGDYIWNSGSTLPYSDANTIAVTGTPKHSSHSSKEQKRKEAIPKVKRIIFNPPATIVLWEDGTKTVVKCMENEPYSEYYGFLCALGKKIFGSNSKIIKLVRSYSEGKDRA